MSETMHASDEIEGVHSGGAPHDHHDGGGHDDAAHGGGAHGASLGPIDWFAWGAGFVGIAAGLAVAACLYISTSL